MFTKVIIEHNFHNNRTEIVYKAKTFKELWDSPEFYSIDDGVYCRFFFVLIFLSLLKITHTFRFYLKWLLKRRLRRGEVDGWEYESLTGKSAPKIKKNISTTPKVGICYTHYNHNITYEVFGDNKRILNIECVKSKAPGVIYIFNKYWYKVFKKTGVLQYILEILARKEAFNKRISVYELKGYKRPSSKQEV